MAIPCGLRSGRRGEWECGLISPLLRLRACSSHRLISSCSFALSAPHLRNVSSALRASEAPLAPPRLSQAASLTLSRQLPRGLVCKPWREMREVREQEQELAGKQADLNSLTWDFHPGLPPCLSFTPHIIRNRSPEHKVSSWRGSLSHFTGQLRTELRAFPRSSHQHATAHQVPFFQAH